MAITKWQLETSALTVRRAGKTAEEASELANVGARIVIQGIDEIDPHSGKTNRLRFIEEMADVLAQIDANIQMLGLDREFIEERRKRKLANMYEWEDLYKL